MGYFAVVVVAVGSGQTRALTYSHVNTSDFDALCDTFLVQGKVLVPMPGQKLWPHSGAVSRNRAFRGGRVGMK